MKLFAVILTYNERENITACIETVRFADRIIVLDSYSQDDTAVLALEAGAELIERPFDNYASQRNAALAAVRGRADWVLFVDADERVTPALEDEILRAIEQPGYAGWRIPRLNYIFGRLTRGAGWYPDYQTRLLRVGRARYDETRAVHELVVLDGQEGTLTKPFLHYNYKTVAQFHAKQERYARLEAQTMFEKGIVPKPRNFVLQPLRQFWWRFITLGGIREGFHGLRLCTYLAWYEYRKYVMLRALWQQQVSDRVR
ncbi:MAG: glycosyltransferase family 2 protein [Chloroflexota bacterium]